MPPQHHSLDQRAWQSDRPRRIIAKLGTNLLTAGGEQLDPATLDDLTRQIAQVRELGAQIAVVTSGAVAAGRARVGARADSASVAARQALAAIGQAHLVERYDSLLRRYGLTAAQALITRGDVTERRGYLNVRNTLLRLLQYNVIPIINENDVVADEELRGGAFGENDALSALVANLIDADLLILLSDVDGVYDRDPRLDPDARLIRELEHPGEALELAGDVGARGRGGMRAKLDAAQLASSGGADVVIASGREPNAILRIAQGEPLGTRIPAQASRRASRQRWLLAGLHNGGGVTLDGGAVRALREQGRSLLPVGVTAVQGRFERGDVIQLFDAEGTAVAVGISNYSSDEIKRIAGRRSDEIAEALGYDYGAEVVHRNNLALATPIQTAPA